MRRSGGGAVWRQFFSLMCPQCTEQCRAQNRGPGAGGGKNGFSLGKTPALWHAPSIGVGVYKMDKGKLGFRYSLPHVLNHQRCLGAAFLMVRRNVLFNKCLVNVGKVPLEIYNHHVSSIILELVIYLQCC